MLMIASSETRLRSDRPAAKPLQRLAAGGALARNTGALVRGHPAEPVLEIQDIQGNILAGFNKDFQIFLFLKIIDPPAAKAWMRMLTAFIATAEDVLAFNRLYRSLRVRRAHEPRGLVATWVNIAFSWRGLYLLNPEADQFADAAFKLGMAQRSGILGDPVDPTAEGNVANWVIGGTGSGPGRVPETDMHIVLIVASDDPEHLRTEVDWIKASIDPLPGSLSDSRTPGGVQIVFEQQGAVRQDMPGYEHFGFKDGLSQPGIRGRLSDARQDFLTPRLIEARDRKNRELAKRFAKPGQPLVWPGQFVFGYPEQADDDMLQAREPAAPVTPAWARNGAFLVFRRLRQDVAAFRAFVTAGAAQLAMNSDSSKITAESFAAKLMGRWPSGAPLMRSPDADLDQLGQDNLANNSFGFANATDPVQLVPIQGYEGDTFAPAPGDDLGVRCPYAAHIRKVNPRDDTTDLGGAAATLTRRILRRGIPYGEPLAPGVGPDQDPARGDRGLLFLSYQTSIEKQFEFLCNGWTNHEDRPNPGANAPLSAGHDLIMGQNGAARDHRVRRFLLPVTAGAYQLVEAQAEWVIPTGGGYFFAPSISALRDHLAGPG